MSGVADRYWLMILARLGLILLSVPGVLIILLAGGSAISLIGEEVNPDRQNIDHVAGSLALFPVVGWALLGVGYLVVLGVFWRRSVQQKKGRH